MPNRLIQENQDHPEILNINCVDPLNRSALIAAIENENIELIKLLLESGIEVKVNIVGSKRHDVSHENHARWAAPLIIVGNARYADIP